MSADESRPPLLVVKGDATAEEVAALVAVLQSVATAGGPAEPPEPRSEWAAPHRRVGASFPFGAAGWRSSSLPR
ncbi:MAG TPA: acyl-CoA carboxylase subunit epsilon [Nocardioidaceae bacterium]|nr:acyl-CoA carboxylase subunit epsilon [Nocardioidaceae bacterium]